MKVHALVERCPPLDPNSVYCNLLQCHHFAETSIVAENTDGMVGFISGYLVPGQSDTLFVWQVAVDESARGQGLALAMLQQLLARESCAGVTKVHTTITSDNNSSWALFRKLAKTLETNLSEQVLFERDQHFAGEHDSEILVCVGPIKAGNTSIENVGGQ